MRSLQANKIEEGGGEEMKLIATFSSDSGNTINGSFVYQKDMSGVQTLREY